MSDNKRVCTRDSNLCQSTKTDSEHENVQSFSSKSLLDICIVYVAQNTHHVDSFWGFPDIIGQKIFGTAIKLGKMDRHNTKLENAINPFCDAYGSNVMDTLCLQSQHLVLNNYLETICLFKYVRKLDISFCGLGDNHEILHQVSKLCCIETLSLRGNMLSNDGMRKMTAPIRMFRQDSSLEYLDISDNQLTETGVKFVECFENIKIVNISTIKIKNYNNIKVKGLHLNTDMGSVCTEIFQVTTSGWAAPVVSLWCQETQNLPKDRQLKKSTFYSSSQQLADHCKSSDKPQEPVYKHLLVADDFFPGKQSQAHNITIHDVNILKTFNKSKKPKGDRPSCDKENKTAPKKTDRKEVGSDDEDLMKMYGGECCMNKTSSLKEFLSGAL